MAELLVTSVINNILQSSFAETMFEEIIRGSFVLRKMDRKKKVR
jgi:hypothetical protein